MILFEVCKGAILHICHQSIKQSLVGTKLTSHLKTLTREDFKKSYLPRWMLHQSLVSSKVGHTWFRFQERNLYDFLTNTGSSDRGILPAEQLSTPGRGSRPRREKTVIIASGYSSR